NPGGAVAEVTETDGERALAQVYNGHGEVIERILSHDSDVVAGFDWSDRDGWGRVTGEQATLDGTVAERGFVYDPLGQLVEVNDGNGTVLEAYGYDDDGNRTATTVDGVTLHTTYDLRNRP